MRVALLSDAHLRGPEDPNQALLLRFLATLEADRVCLLGDVFSHWWHFGRTPFSAYAPVIEALRRFPLVFVPGNHDWHAASFFRGELGATVGDPVREHWDGLAVHLAHGDEADRSPGYRLTARVLRGRPFARMVDAMGPTRAWRFLGRLAGAPHAGEAPVALLSAQEAQARAHLREGADLVVFGHTHAPGLVRFPEGVYVNLGDWVRHHTWLRVDDGVPELMRYEG